MLFRRTVAIIFALMTAVAIPATAAERASASTNESQGILGLLPADSATQHVLKTPAGDLPYTATAGTLSLYGQDGKISAKIFYTAYVAKDGGAKRPLTFAFNGGPGAASAYLNLGLVGPRILEFGPDNNDGSAPILKDNPESWLGFTDLVLIDPVGTGWSRAAGNDGNGFWNVRADAEAMAKVITLYVQHNKRLGSAKFLLGESYGGFRAAKVATALKENQGVVVSGIIMLSPLIDSQFIFGGSDSPLVAAMQLPSLAAAELERKKAFSSDAVAKAETFAMTDYLVTMAGPQPAGATAVAFYSRLSTMTGIPKDEVTRTRGFLSNIYKKNVQPGRIASPYDASYTVPDPYPELSYDGSDDPILDGFTRAYGAAFSAYARNELGYACDVTYNLLEEDVAKHWDWNGNRATADATDDVRELLSTMPSFRLMIAHGYSDALTPFGASRYILNHLPPALAEHRTALKLYRGGHMFYTHPDSRRAMAADARKFYAGEMGTE